ncbi:MAG: hypothetical protein ACHQX1_02680 [Candidatus Micrarchaeales archaeon]
MKTNTKIILLLSLLFSAALPASAFAAVSGGTFPNPPNFYVDSQVPTLCAGLMNIIPINVVNTGVVSVGGPQAGPSLQSVQLSVSNTKYLYSGRNASTVAIGGVPAGSSAIGYLPVFVAANASSIVSLGLNVNYYFDSLYTNSAAFNLTFETRMCPMPLSVTLSPQVLTSGNIENVSVNITNTANVPLNIITVHFSLPSVDGTWLSPPLQINSLAPMSTVNFNESIFVYRNATQSFPLNISANYYINNSIGQIFNSDKILTTGLIGLTPTTFTISPQTPSPDSIFSISFVLTNIGTTGASAVTVTALPPSGFSAFGSQSVFVGDISPDTQTPVTLTLQSSNSLNPGTYKIPIQINYLNGLRQNQSLDSSATVVIVPAQTNSTLSNARYSTSGGGSGGLVIILVIVVIVLGYLYYKERKRRSK